MNRAPKKNYSGDCINKFIHFLDIHDVFDKTPLFFLETGNHVDYFFSMLSARTGWDSCLMVSLCTGIFLGLYRICEAFVWGGKKKCRSINVKSKGWAQI